MKTVTGLFASAALMCLGASAANAAARVYTNQADFTAAITGAQTLGFAGTPNGTSTPTYQLGPVNFTGANPNDPADFMRYDDIYGAPYLASFYESTTVSSITSALGLSLGGFFNDVGTISYSFGTLSGDIELPGDDATTFIGFTNDNGGPVSVLLSGNGSELDFINLAVGTSTTSASSTGTTGIATAVPEPATWGMMILGFGMVGAAMRRRRHVATRMSYAN